MSSEEQKPTLGCYRAMAVFAFGEDSPAVQYLDNKIAESQNGENEEVVAHETQVMQLLVHTHKAGEIPSE